MTPKKILALDPANLCGWAHSSGQYGLWQLNTGGSGEHPGLRLQRLMDNIRMIHRRYGVEEIAFEDASFGANSRLTAASHNAYKGAILLTALELGSIPVRPYNPIVIKQYATGNCRAKKGQMIAACRTLLKIEVQDDNIADALWILDMAKSGYSNETHNQRAKRLAGIKPKRKSRTKKGRKLFK